MSAFVAATPEKEHLTDLQQVAQHEMWYTIEQGINSRLLVATNARMTLKQLCLFGWEQQWSEQRQAEYWRTIIQLAVVSGAGLFVLEVFRKNKKLSESALEWMMQFDRTQPFSEPYYFMPPRYANQPCVGGGGGLGGSDEEGGGGGGDEGSSHSGDTEEDVEGEGGDEERSRELVPHRPRNTRSRTGLEATHDMVAMLGAHLYGMNTLKEVLQGVEDFDPQVHNLGPIVTPPSFEIDPRVLISCVNILRTRDDALVYKEKLPLLRKEVVEEEKEEETEQSGSDTGEGPKVSGSFFLVARYQLFSLLVVVHIPACFSIF